MISRMKSSADPVSAPKEQRANPHATAASMFFIKQFPDVLNVAKLVMEANADSHVPWRDAAAPSAHLEKCLGHLAKIGRDVSEPHGWHAIVRFLMWAQLSLERQEFEAGPTLEVREHVKNLRTLLRGMGFSSDNIDALPDKIAPGERISFVQYGTVQVRAIDGSARAIHRSEL
jgi:hypothetical protein